MENKTAPLIKVKRTLQSYSIDVVAGSLATGLFAVKWCGVTMQPAWWFILAIAVWIIYTADHIIDSLSKKETSLIYRHKIHYVFKYRLMALVIVSGISALLLSVIFLDKKTLLAGTVLGFVVFLYLIAVSISGKKAAYFFKEFFIALIYVAGIWLSPLINSQNKMSMPTVALLFVFVLLVLAEGLTVSVYEMDMDKADNQKSFALKYGAAATNNFVVAVLLLAFAISLYFVLKLSDSHKRYFFVITSIMDVMLSGLLVFKKYFKKGNRYRSLGETVFWLPAIIVWL